MAKLPFMKLYPADAIVDTQTLTMEEFGCYFKLLFHIWVQSDTGMVEITTPELACLWHMAEWQKADEMMVQLFKKLSLDGGFDPEKVVWEVISRRISRDKKALSMNALRVSNHRVMVLSQKCNADVMPKKLEAMSLKTKPLKTLKTLKTKPLKTKTKDIGTNGESLALESEPEKDTTNFWKELLAHVSKRKDGTPYLLPARHFRELKGLARIYQPWGVMALWDEYLTLTDEWARGSGYSFAMFVAKLPALLDSRWKVGARGYESRLLPPIGDVVANLAVSLSTKKV